MIFNFEVTTAIYGLDTVDVFFSWVRTPFIRDKGYYALSEYDDIIIPPGQTFYIDLTFRTAPNPDTHGFKFFLLGKRDRPA